MSHDKKFILVVELDSVSEKMLDLSKVISWDEMVEYVLRQRPAQTHPNSLGILGELIFWDHSIIVNI